MKKNKKQTESGTPLILRFIFHFLLPFSLAQTLRDEQRYRQQKYDSPSYQKTGKIIFVVIYWKSHKTCIITIMIQAHYMINTKYVLSWQDIVG